MTKTSINPPEPIVPKKGMNKWLSAFCWGVIFVSIYFIWRGYTSSYGSPASESPALWNDGVQSIVTGVSVWVVLLGAILAGWRGGLAVGVVVAVLTPAVKFVLF